MKNGFYGYLRMSTQKQGEKGVSLTEQKAAIERYAARNGYEITKWFEERQTAAKSGRRVFQAMIQGLRKSEAAGVIIHKIDRSARNLRDWADLGELIDAGVVVHFAHESIDLNSRGGRLSADIQAVVAADFIRNLREETRKGFYGRLKQGLYPLQAPLGYQDNGPGTLKTIDPVAGPLVKLAFSLYASGGYNLKTLKAELHARGLRNRRGGTVSLNGISKILNNPFYMGIIRLTSTGEVFQGKHETLVSASQFERVQRVLAGKYNPRSYKYSFPYRRLFRCGYCKYALIGEKQKGIVYYRCHTKGCLTKAVREDVIDRIMRRHIQALSIPTDVLQDLHTVIESEEQNQAEERQNYEKSLQLSLQNVQQRHARLTDAYLDNVVDKDDYERRKAALLHEERGLKDKLHAAQHEYVPIPERIVQFLERVKTLPDKYDCAYDDDKRELVEHVTSNRIVSGKNIDIKLASPFFEFASALKSTYCDPYRGRPRINAGKKTRVVNKHIRPLYTTLKEYAEEEERREKEERARLVQVM